MVSLRIFFTPAVLVFGILGLLTACAVPQAHLPGVGGAEVKMEQDRQKDFLFETWIDQLKRIHRLGQPLAYAAVPFCPDVVGRDFGFAARNRHSFPEDFQDAAQRAGFGEKLIIVSVSPGSAAEAAGLSPGDIILELNQQYMSGGRANNILETTFSPSIPETLDLKIIPSSSTDETQSRVIHLESIPSCPYAVFLTQSADVNAFADGQNVFLTTGIVNFLREDNELSAVIAHEIAHNARGHVEAKKDNALVGLFFGGMVDILAASVGVYTDFKNIGTDLGSQAFSQDFEAEADYVSLYIMARAGLPLEEVPKLWRRMATLNPEGISHATTHPSSAERFILLENTLKEIEDKKARGLPLIPNERERDGAEKPEQPELFN